MVGELIVNGAMVHFSFGPTTLLDWIDCWVGDVGVVERSWMGVARIEVRMERRSKSAKILLLKALRLVCLGILMATVASIGGGLRGL